LYICWRARARPTDEDPIEELISGPIFVTLSGQNTCFDFDSGEITEDTDAADIKLTAVQYGNEYTLIKVINDQLDFKGIWLRPDVEDVTDDPEAAYYFFRTLAASNWQEQDNGDMGSLQIDDTLLLKTSEGRFVKVFIIDVRGHWQHDDAPAVDFVYQFTNEIDNEPPVLEQVTVITVDGQEISQPVTDVIEFDIIGEPESLVFDFNEIVYRNRGLLQYQEEWPNYTTVFWTYESPSYYLRPSRSKQFHGNISYSPESGTIIMTEGEDSHYSSYENEYFTDYGYYFSDLSGNRWEDLPFTEIRIRYEYESVR